MLSTAWRRVTHRAAESGRPSVSGLLGVHAGPGDRGLPSRAGLLAGASGAASGARAPGLGLGVGLAPGCGALLQQVRFGPKDGRPGRLQHWRFGCDKVKGRYYYRFHKLIGKWNWRKYTERYLAPRALENRQRWIPTPYATYTQARHSYSWYWRLPKGLAGAVTADAVLEVWITFRHKLPKKTYHYFKVLKRLVDVGGCDPSDWRLKFITTRVHSIHRKVLNLPRLALLYAQLKVTDQLEHLSRFLYRMLPKYSPSQLALTAHAFGVAKMQDKHLFSQVAELLGPQLDKVTPTELVRLAQAFAATEICHYTFLTQLSAQVQVRVQQSCEGISPPGTCPTFEQLTEIAEAFARLKLQDYSYMEMCSLQTRELLLAGLPGPTPPSLARLCGASARLKVHDVRLYSAVLAHASQHWYDYPAAVLAQIGLAVSPTLPQGPPPLQKAYRRLLAQIVADRDRLSLKGVEQAARFMAELDHKGEFMPGVAQSLQARLRQLKEESKERYDVARVTEIFSRRFPDDHALFATLCRHLHRHLALFEPVDFARFARGLARAAYRDDRVVQALTNWAHKRLDEFSRHDLESFRSSLLQLGAREVQLQERLQPQARQQLLLEPQHTQQPPRQQVPAA